MVPKAELRSSPETRHLIETKKKAYVAEEFPHATGRTTKPEEFFGKTR